MGEFTFTVLAVFGSICNRLDGRKSFTKWPVAFYGSILLMNGVAYTVLAKILMKQAGENSKLVQAFGKDQKGKVSVLLYMIAVALAFVDAKISLGIYAFIALIWFIPDTRIEQVLFKKEK